MAITYSALTQAIQDYCETNETTFVANLPLMIKQAEDRILKGVQLPDFRKNVTGQMQINNEYLEVPTDFLAPYSLAVDNSGYEYLTFKDVSSIKEMYPVNTSTGVPKYYAMFDDASFILGPTPDAGYLVELHYFYKPTSIVDSGDGTSWLGDNAESALLYGCLVEAYTFLKGDQDVMAMYMGRYQEALDRLKGVGEGYSTTDSYRSGDVRSTRS